MNNVLNKPAELNLEFRRPAAQEATSVSASAFIDKSGKLYIRQRRADGGGYRDRCTVWASIDAYNNRIPGPLTFVDTSEALADFSQIVTIHARRLKATLSTGSDNPSKEVNGGLPA